ncbi:nuclear transport factor 2 family protein [Sphingobium sufflavum]|uniref:nuclear transport factor 2 family protein n=1 Tax=Sphingobium sufflavum TaxID=1129547 RepID=UPI001F193A3B|nr:nuclear transport factor 2 family protein [Sphingobium sufflavum]MCE7796663.1 nuclear transport factor 2 family protein [Sphingobium sufflavum]
MADTGSPSDLATRIRLLEARGAIADLVHRYALHIRARQPEACDALFTPDGEFLIRDTDPGAPTDFTTRARSVGRDAIRAYVMGSTRAGFHVFPMIRNLLIDVDGDTATATSLMSSRTWPAGAEVFGEYQDSFREEAGVWLFSKRIFTIYRRPG